MEVNIRYKMPLKAVQPAQHTLLIKEETLGPAGIQSDTSIAKSSNQLVEWYRDIITQLMDNQVVLK